MPFVLYDGDPTDNANKVGEYTFENGQVILRHEGSSETVTLDGDGLTTAAVDTEELSITGYRTVGVDGVLDEGGQISYGLAETGYDAYLLDLRIWGQSSSTRHQLRLNGDSTANYEYSMAGGATTSGSTYINLTQQGGGYGIYTAKLLVEMFNHGGTESIAVTSLWSGEGGGTFNGVLDYGCWKTSTDSEKLGEVQSIEIADWDTGDHQNRTRLRVLQLEDIA